MPTKTKKPATPKQLRKARMKIDTRKREAERLSLNAGIASDKVFGARIDYLRLAGWELVRAGRHPAQYLCRLSEGSTWYGLWDAEKRQRDRERRAEKRRRKAKAKA